MDNVLKTSDAGKMDVDGKVVEKTTGVISGIDTVDKVDGEDIRRPYWIWGSGRSFYPSKWQRIVAERFLETYDYGECLKALESAGCRKVDKKTVMYWLKKEPLASWLREQVEERGLCEGWSKGRWLKVMTDHLQGVKRLMGGDLYGMKLIADVMGYSEEMRKGSKVGIINFIQNG